MNKFNKNNPTEIDKLIAVYVMNWTPKIFAGGAGSGVFVSAYLDKDGDIVRYINHMTIKEDHYFFKPTINISDCFLALGEVNKKYDYVIERRSDLFYVEIFDEDNFFIGEAKRPELAICYALLKYKGFSFKEGGS